MGTKDRRTRVLKAIVRDYVSAREPVGSRSLVERYDLGVSPATIRNDMAALEEAGLIHQPHTSAGRIPTDQGYRHFVDSLDAVKPLSAPERRAIERVLSGAVDLDDVIARAVRALAQITQQAAVVQYPSLQRVSLRHIELIPSGAGRVILVIITEAGRVEQRTLVMAGAAHLSRHSVDFARSISPVLDALEEQVVLLRLLAAMQDGVSVSIGEENPYEELSEASVVSSTYDVAEQSVARVGVIGPTRMDYPGTMAAVYAISRYLSDILSNR